MDRDLLGASLIVSGMMLDSSPFYAMVSAPEPTVERDTVTSFLAMEAIRKRRPITLSTSSRVVYYMP